VTIELEPDAGEAGATPPEKGGSRVRFLLLTVVALLVVTAVAAAWAWNYQPLTPVTIGGVEAPDATVRAASNSYGTEYWISEPAPGSVVTLNVSFEMPDDVRFPVTIDDVKSPFPVVGEGQVAQVESVAVSYRVNAQGAWTPLTDGPVSLESGEFLMLRVELVIPDCPPMDDGAMVGTDSLPVTYSALGITHETDLPMGYKVNLRNAPQCR
jgi:hypothetical protein